MKIQIAPALEWWLTSQGKFTSGCVSISEGTIEISPNTFSGDGNFQINSWNVSGVPQPDDLQLEKIVSDYDSAMQQKATDDANKKAALFQKLGITQDEFNLLAGT